MDSNNKNSEGETIHSILDQQLDFFKKTLNENYRAVKNIFIIPHHLIYYDKNRGPFSKARPNAGMNYENSEGEVVHDSNFWPTLYPILENLNNNIFIISGDTGTVIGKELFCHKSRNITFLATGLGGVIAEGEAGRSEHYLIIDSIKQIIKMRVKVI